jgi:hypothetical protein
LKEEIRQRLAVEAAVVNVGDAVRPLLRDAVAGGIVLAGHFFARDPAFHLRHAAVVVDGRKAVLRINRGQAVAWWDGRRLRRSG